MPSILLIDDDHDFRDYLRLVLQRYGHQVVTLPNGAGLSKVLENVRIDAVITDLYMPDRDGIETVRQLGLLAPEIPVIAISGAGVADDPCVRAMRMLGASVVLEKPIRAPALIAALDSMLARRATARPATAH
jgi:two-component system chemotaxis response regulator CheY